MKRTVFFLLLGILTMNVGQVRASVVSYTDQASWQAAIGTSSTADFEGFAGAIGNRYSGVTFQDFNGGSPFSINQFPYQGSNSLFSVFALNGGGGGWAADFDDPVKGVAFWSGDVEYPGSYVSVYNASRTLLATFDLLATGGGHGPFMYGFNGLLSSQYDIVRVEVSINHSTGVAGDAVWFDNLQYSPQHTSAIPEPSTLVLFGAGMLALALRRTKNS